MEISVSKGDIIEWRDFDNNRKLGLVLDIIEDVLENDVNWLHVSWTNGLSHIRTLDIRVISPASIQREE